MHESQAGFRRQYSTVDNIFILHALAHKKILVKREVDSIVYLYISESF